MAKDEKPAAEGGDRAPARNKKLLIIIAAVVLLLGIGAGTTFLLLKHSAEHDDEDEVAVEKVKPVKRKKNDRGSPPVYVALDAFTVNLVPEHGDQYLQLVVSLEVDEPQTAEQLKVYMPKLRNDVTLLLSSKKGSDLVTTSGKEQLAEEIKDKINGILDPASKGKKHDWPVKEVLFTSFIIQ